MRMARETYILLRTIFLGTMTFIILLVLFPRSFDSESTGRVFRIFVLAYNRADSLQRCLNSLNEASYFGNIVHMEIWLDRHENGSVDTRTLNVARGFRFNHGSVQANVQPKHVGITGQWIDTWKPEEDTKDIALFIEDDTDVSIHFYRWLRSAHDNLISKDYISGFTLQRKAVLTINKQAQLLHLPDQYGVFLYPVVGPWGFSPVAKHWRRFQHWYHSINPSTYKPYVPRIVQTKWYKDLEMQHKQHTMWSIWMTYYNWRQKTFCLYSNPVDRQSLSSNRREKGLHYPAPLGKEWDVVKTWHDKLIDFNSTIPYVGYNGNILPNKEDVFTLKYMPEIH